MVAQRLTEHEWATAQTVCTTKQLQALDYWRHGYGYKRISIILGIPRDTARARIDRARDTITRTLAPSDDSAYHSPCEAA